MLVQYSERYEVVLTLRTNTAQWFSARGATAAQVSPFNTGGGGTPADYAWMLGCVEITRLLSLGRARFRFQSRLKLGTHWNLP